MWPFSRTNGMRAELRAKAAIECARTYGLKIRARATPIFLSARDDLQLRKSAFEALVHAGFDEDVKKRLAPALSRLPSDLRDHVFRFVFSENVGRECKAFLVCQLANYDDQTWIEEVRKQLLSCEDPDLPSLLMEGLKDSLSVFQPDFGDVELAAVAQPIEERISREYVRVLIGLLNESTLADLIALIKECPMPECDFVIDQAFDEIKHLMSRAGTDRERLADFEKGLRENIGTK